MTQTEVSVMIPLLDDLRGIGPCITSVLAQQTPTCRIARIVVADGGSVDGSREVVAGFPDERISLIDNPDRFVSAGLNAALRTIDSEIVVRVDSHTTLAPDYVEQAVRVLRETGADVVGGPMRPRSTKPFGAAVAWALCSRWGIGGSRFHDETSEGPTDSAYMGVFARSTFDRVGGYDPTFVRDQDDELTYRIRERGGTVWLSPALRSEYEPRSDVRALWRQFRGYGRYKPLVLVAHPSGARPRHLIPGLTAIAWSLAVGSLLVRRGRVVTAAPAAHLAAVLVASRRGPGRLHHRVTALMAMHLGYGFGTLHGLAAVIGGDRASGGPDVSCPKP